MAIRGRSPAKGSELRLHLREFGWRPSRIAVLGHCTLPWFENLSPTPDIAAVPLTVKPDLGKRDRLSLLGQYAAHQSILKSAGLADEAFNPADWSVSRLRAGDCRLIRLHGGAVRAKSEVPSIALVEELARYISSPPLPVLTQSWAKPESVYHEIERTFRSSATADLTWFRRSSTGCIYSPGIESLDSLLSQPGRRVTFTDGICVDRLVFASSIGLGSRVVVLGPEGCSPLQPLSAALPFEELIGAFGDATEASLAERIIEASGDSPLIITARRSDSFDLASRRLVRLLASLGPRLSFVLPEDDVALLDPGSAWEPVAPTLAFIVSPRLVPVENFQARTWRLGTGEIERWLAEISSGDSLGRFLDEGALPELSGLTATSQLGEPRRSFLAALSLLGREIPADLVTEFLQKLGCPLPLEQLSSPGFATVDGESFCFFSEAVRQELTASLPHDARPALARMAAGMLELRFETVAAARLFATAGDFASAARLLATSDWAALPAAETVALLSSMPGTLLDSSPQLRRRLAESLIAVGRYQSARRTAEMMTGRDRTLIEAQVLRRTGNYAAARELLRSVNGDHPTLDSLLLGAELSRLVADLREAESLLERAEVFVSSGGVPELEYEKAMLQLERGSPITPSSQHGPDGIDDIYLHERLASYCAVDGGDFVKAAAHAERAVMVARTVPAEIDATLDLLYVLFTSGEWNECRSTAFRALALVEETEGDRGAGGILFLLAFLSADSGHWNQARALIERLERFYRSTGDDRRLAELDLLEAQLALGQCRFDDAARHASRLAAATMPDDIAEAGRLVVDEVNWVTGVDGLVSTGRARCTELRRRHAFQKNRRSKTVAAPDGFPGALAQWERNRAVGTVPECGDVADTLLLLRALLRLDRREPSKGWREKALALASEVRVKLPEIDRRLPGEAREIELLQRLSTSSYPFEPSGLGSQPWRFVTRNRLGHWTESGSAPRLGAKELDRLTANPESDWIRAGDSSFVWVEGQNGFSEESRQAIAALFRLRAEHHNLRRALEQDEQPAPGGGIDIESGIVGGSPAMKELLARLVKVAKRDIAVCVLGESGTGKELIARAVHKNSPRRGRPFTAVNCAALPENLIESELFGHVKGAFTGADRDRPGLIEASEGGTLFLDEIGEMPLTAQAKLLRFLQEGELRRVGDTVNRTADVRIVVATNQKLEAAVDRGRFREDLYYRVRGIELNVPPLRDRGGDILAIAEHFLAGERTRHRTGPDRLSDEVESIFTSYPWPGNVRELQQAIRAAHAMAGDARELTLEHLPERFRSVLIVRRASGSYFEEMLRFRRSLIESSLGEAKGNQNRAAKLLGLSRQALAYQIRELGILVQVKREE